MAEEQEKRGKLFTLVMLARHRTVKAPPRWSAMMDEDRTQVLIRAAGAHGTNGVEAGVGRGFRLQKSLRRIPKKTGTRLRWNNNPS